MKVHTEFGEFEVAQNDIIHFEFGLYGFENIKNYVLLSQDEMNHVMILQSATSKVPSFVLIDPFAVVNDYHPILPKSELQYFKVQKESDLRFLVIAAIKDDFSKTLVNLKSPIVINPTTNKAKQVVLETNAYPIRYPLFKNGEATSCL